MDTYEMEEDYKFPIENVLQIYGKILSYINKDR